MVGTKVAILADSFRVESAIAVATLRSQLGTALSMVTVQAHSIGVVLLVEMLTLCYHLPVLLVFLTRIFLARKGYLGRNYGWLGADDVIFVIYVRRFLRLLQDLTRVLSFEMKRIICG